jgi:release factor glutamine methyltransferase
MRNSKAILRDLQQQITLKEDLSEIRSILYLVLENVLGLSQADVFADKAILIDDQQQKKLADAISRINNHEPVQYILGSTYFYGRRFKVNGSVLIPRPETELLIEEILKEVNPFTPGTILDIGTGSGCIAITLANELPEKRIVALDISDEALKVAKENASQLNAPVEFHRSNALIENFPCQDLEMIVSNPPYITASEKGEMKNNVLNFEPHLALFVSDGDPLIFYRMIAEKGVSSLRENGKILVEINERFGNKVANLFIKAGFKNTRIIKDLQQKDRIVFASK